MAFLLSLKKRDDISVIHIHQQIIGKVRKGKCRAPM
jgi:hypothetical protein